MCSLSSSWKANLQHNIHSTTNEWAIPSLEKHFPQPCPHKGQCLNPKEPTTLWGDCHRMDSLGSPESEMKIREREVNEGCYQDHPHGTAGKEAGWGRVISARPHPGSCGNSKTGMPFRGIQLGQGDGGFIYTAAPTRHGCRLLQEGDVTLEAGGSALLPKQFPIACSIPAAKEKGLPVQGGLGSPSLPPLQRSFHGGPACLNMSKSGERTACFPSALQ